MFISVFASKWWISCSRQPQQQRNHMKATNWPWDFWSYVTNVPVCIFSGANSAQELLHCSLSTLPVKLQKVCYKFSGNWHPSWHWKHPKLLISLTHAAGIWHLLHQGGKREIYWGKKSNYTSIFVGVKSLSLPGPSWTSKIGLKVLLIMGLDYRYALWPLHGWIVYSKIRIMVDFYSVKSLLEGISNKTTKSVVGHLESVTFIGRYHLFIYHYGYEQCPVCF